MESLPGNKEVYNFFDEEHPLFTRTPIWDVLRSGFDAMPSIDARTRPAVVVTVTSGGKPVPEAVVYCVPADGQWAGPLGVRADRSGRALFVLPQPGKYHVATDASENARPLVVDLDWGRAGSVVVFSDVKSIDLDIKPYALPPAVIVPPPIQTGLNQAKTKRITASLRAGVEKSTATLAPPPQTAWGRRSSTSAQSPPSVPRHPPARTFSAPTTPRT